ncbi:MULTISPECIES: ArsR/SmtB family transcription factor [Roseobacteraceae]|uniref:ArsR/SmtB family transcription factor n=1 Tax=Roseobacteraceae TaxID=2854170 RepID=UPI00147F8AAC|nr:MULTISPECIES: metalloregulator ArsR/SmtB family transcription factor [Roseobacteraceae]MCA0873939.1 metalloregulator ArsR/SmtB family transcription factor [Seohaeicola saemankumensis]MCT8160006.1 metalloregulator ArsR/SmtB family transcription factor [Pseudoruegeria sp. SHC-113]
MEEIATDRNPVEAAIEQRAKLFRGLADPSRLAILDALRTGPLVVHEIVERTGLTQPNVSNHLRCLSDCGLVESARDGRFVRYKVSSPQIMDLLREADALLNVVAEDIKACRNYRVDGSDGPPRRA